MPTIMLCKTYYYIPAFDIQNGCQLPKYTVLNQQEGDSNLGVPIGASPPSEIAAGFLRKPVNNLLSSRLHKYVHPLT